MHVGEGHVEAGRSDGGTVDHRRAEPGQAKILAAYDGFMKAYVATFDGKNPAIVGGDLTLYGGSGHGGLDTDLASAEAARVNATGKPSWTTPTVTVDAFHGQATGANCFDPAAWRTVSMSSQQPTKPPAGSAVDKPRPAYPGDAAGKYQTVTTFDQDGTGLGRLRDRRASFAIVLTSASMRRDAT